MSTIPTRWRAPPSRHAAAAAFRAGMSRLSRPRISMPAARAGVLPPIRPCGVTKLEYGHSEHRGSSLFMPRAGMKRSANSPVGRSLLLLLTISCMWMPRTRQRPRPLTTRYAFLKACGLLRAAGNERPGARPGPRGGGVAASRTAKLGCRGPCGPRIEISLTD